jgi:SPP1 family predicted phage head-tail adaptor
MRAGPLDRRVVLQRPTDVQDAAGGITQTWADVATVWAQRQDVRAREFVAANVTLAEVDAVFRIRHRADLAPRWRILADARVFEITGITQLGRLDGLELRCTAVQEG